MTSKECLRSMCLNCEKEKATRYQRCPFRSISNDYCEEYETIEKELDRLERVEKLTHLIYAQRKALKIEFDMWCKKNNADKNDKTNVITWLLCIKLKEVLENGK